MFWWLHFGCCGESGPGTGPKPGQVEGREPGVWLGGVVMTVELVTRVTGRQTDRQTDGPGLCTMLDAFLGPSLRLPSTPLSSVMLCSGPCRAPRRLLDSPARVPRQPVQDGLSAPQALV